MARRPDLNQRAASVFPARVEISGKSRLVLVEQIAAVDPERLGQLVGHLTQREMANVEQAIRVVFHLS